MPWASRGILPTPAIQCHARASSRLASAILRDTVGGFREVIMRRRLLCCLLSALAGLLVIATSEAMAHPHVWVTTRTEVLYAPDGSITGLRHAWTFDDMFSIFATQGLQTKEKGVFSREDLAPLAEVNITSLKEYDYFTVVKANGRKAQHSDPVDYWLDFTNGVLTLHFVLPVNVPAKVQNLEFEVFDPTYFINFGLAESAPVALVGASDQCKITMMRPTNSGAPGQPGQPGQNVGEDFFNSLTANSNYGAKYSTKVWVKCP